MARRVSIQAEGKAFDLTEVKAPSEFHLQGVLKERPQLIPSEDLGLDGDLLVIGRETALASGYIDLLCLSRSGELVLIEFKTGPQNPDFRHALAQLIDYGSDLWQLSIDDFDRGVVQRYLASGHATSEVAGLKTLDQAAAHAWGLDSEGIDHLRSRLSEVLVSGAFHYVVAAQRFTGTMMTSLDYLNSTMRQAKFFLVEIVQLEGGGIIGHAAQVVASPPKRATTPASSGGLTNESLFLGGIDDEAYRDALHRILAACPPLGLRVEWGSKGASIRLKTPDRQEPLSIGWLLPEGSHWAGVRHASFGVDRESAKSTPSIAAALGRYLEALSHIPGATSTAGSVVTAFTFLPGVLPSAASLVVEAFAALVEADANEAIG